MKGTRIVLLIKWKVSFVFFKWGGMNTGLVSLWPGHWDSPSVICGPGPPSRSQAGKRRNGHVEPAHRRKVLDHCAPASSAQGRPHGYVQPSAGHLGARALPFLSTAGPLPSWLLAPGWLTAVAMENRERSRGGHRAKKEETTLGSQRALCGEGTRGGCDQASAWGTKVSFLYHCVCRMSPTHRALSCSGSLWKYEEVKNGLKTFKNRSSLQMFQHITLTWRACIQTRVRRLF